MFVGHYTDSKDQHDARRTSARLPGEPPGGVMLTWRNLYRMADRAGVRREEIFFTNVYVGLSTKPQARGPFPGRRDPSFRAWCSAFLDEQIQLMRPRAVVTLGDPSAKETGWPGGRVTTKQRAGVEFRAAALMHPSASYWLRQKRPDTGETEMDYQVSLLKEAAAA